MAEVVHACHELPGQELFSYLNNDGQVVDIRSTEVNAYLRAAPRGVHGQGLPDVG